MAGCPPFRPVSVDAVMALQSPDLGEFPRLGAEARRLNVHRSFLDIVLAPEIERWE
jgi:hypothetical protein